MGKERNWTPEEYSYLQENWGTISLPTLCKKLNRSEQAIHIKVQRLGLGAFLQNGEYITFHQLQLALGCTGGAGYKMTSWVKNRDFPVKNKRVNGNTFKIVYLHDFWKWAEKNRNFIDFSKLEENTLGIEPEWVKDQRKLDAKKNIKYITSPWTTAEDSRLAMLVKQYKYTYLELSQMLKRTSGAIQKRLCDLKIKERPVKADNHIKWTDAEYTQLADMIKSGLSYPVMAEILGKSSKALQGRVFDVYRTERLDAVRQMIGEGTWGDGRPVMTVKSSCKKAGTKGDLEKLLSLLLYHRNQLGWDPFWQKDMCMNWHPVKGCIVGQSDCDDCTEFVRIKPQYCVRCGGTFFEREESKLCARCRGQRKKQYQRKWKKLNFKKIA